MYKEFYGLDSKPFSKTPDPAFLYKGKVHNEALARLIYAVEERELLLLTGEIGSGKTTLSRALIDSLDEDRFHIILIINPRLTPTQFLKTIASHLGVDKTRYYRNDVLEQIYEKLYEYYEKDVCPVIIIDEAQLIPTKQTFDEIRLLTNFQLDDTNLFSLALIGQPELRKRLDHKSYRALKQRIGMQYHLLPLTLKEVKKYISYRLAIAGRKKNLFDERAVELIAEFSEGIPRVINNIAANALLEGLGREAETISGAIIENVAGDLGIAKAPRLVRVEGA
jgi:type II secretory pathway predicted ATPase ExeA